MKVVLALTTAFVAIGLTAGANKVTLKTTMLKSTTKTLATTFDGSTSSDCLYQSLLVSAATNLVKTTGTNTPESECYVSYFEYNSCTDEIKEAFLANPTSLSVTGFFQKGFQVTIEGTGYNHIWCVLFCDPDDYYYYYGPEACGECEEVPFSVSATLTPTSATRSQNCVDRYTANGLYRVSNALKAQVRDATVTSLAGYVGDSTLPSTLEDLLYGIIEKATSGYLNITKPAK
jgi:hypothetical protein